MAEEKWASLPSVIIVEIFSYMNLKDKLNASSICTNWRKCLDYPALWRNFPLTVSPTDFVICKQMANLCVRYASDLTIKVSPDSLLNVIRMAQLLGENVALRRLVFDPVSLRIEWPDRPIEYSNKMLVTSLLKCLETAKSFRHFSLGCMEELINAVPAFLTHLVEYQSESLQALHIASIKEDPVSYEPIEFSPDSFSQFKDLRQLSLDYDHVSNMLITALSGGKFKKTSLRKLVIHVHGIEPGREKVTNTSWARFANSNPGVEVTLNLFHSLDGAVALQDILTTALPLAHLRMFYCDQVNVAALEFIGQHMGNSFRSIHIVSGMNDIETPSSYYYGGDENPFVMLAWRCHRLSSFTFIGYEMDRDDLVAIARLRGDQLTSLNVPQCCIFTFNDQDDTIVFGVEDDSLDQEISSSLGRAWHPMPTSDLPRAVFDVEADCEEAYLDIVRQDQQ